MNLERISLGSHADSKYNLSVTVQGLGTMKNVTEEEQAVIKCAIEVGVNFFDTAEMYASGDSEIALGRAIQGYDREKLIISTKVGCTFDQNGLHISGTPEYIESACENSLKRLNVKTIDLLYLHRVDPKTPLEVSVLAMKKLVEAGKVKCIGLSEVTAEQIERANKIHPITAVQIEYSPWSRQDETNGVIETCHRLGIGVVAYSPLGRAFFVQENASQFFNGLEHDFRNYLPRYQGNELAANLKARAIIDDIAKQYGIKTQHLALAWIKAKGIVSIPGTTKIPHLLDNLEACGVNLSDEQVKRIDESLDKAEFEGERYPNAEISGIYPEEHLS